MCSNCCDSVWVDIIGIIVTAVIPVGIMLHTLSKEKSFHYSQMAQIEEKNRIDAMPLIDISGEVVLKNMIEEKVVSISIGFSLMNAGNGTATNVMIDEDGVGRLGNLLPGQSTDPIDLSYEQESVEEVHRIEVTFLDLYGNRYNQMAGLKPIKQSGFWKIVCTEIELPVLVMKGSRNE